MGNVVTRFGEKRVGITIGSTTWTRTLDPDEHTASMQVVEMTCAALLYSLGAGLRVAIEGKEIGTPQEVVSQIMASSRGLLDGDPMVCALVRQCAERVFVHEREPDEKQGEN